MPHLANREPPVARACTCSCARAQRASPAPRPVLPGTRRRKRRRGPFGPWVEKSSCATPSGRRSSRENPFARGAAQAERHPGFQRHRARPLRPRARLEDDVGERSRRSVLGSCVANALYRHFSTSGAGQCKTPCTQWAAARHQLPPPPGPTSPPLDASPAGPSLCSDSHSKCR